MKVFNIFQIILTTSVIHANKLGYKQKLPGAKSPQEKAPKTNKRSLFDMISKIQVW